MTDAPTYPLQLRVEPAIEGRNRLTTPFASSSQSRT
jgi:hypothetical protein